MRIYDQHSDKNLSTVTLYLTPDEAQEMKYALEQMIHDNKKHHHEHIPDRDSDLKREITVCIYTQINSKVGFWRRQLGGKFLALTCALPLGNGRSLRTQKFAPLPCQIPNF